jgi:hypothetical protein
MSVCERYRIEMSALLDGEADPAAALAILDHAAACAGCRAFWREMRRGQALLDRLAPAAEPAAADPQPAVAPRGRRGFRTRTPQWAWGLAALLILAVGLGAVGLMDRPWRDRTPLEGELLTVRLEEDPGGMDELRFVEMTTELLRADRRYHEKMYEVLDRVRELESSDESPRTMVSLRGSRREARSERSGADGLTGIVN